MSSGEGQKTNDNGESRALGSIDIRLSQERIGICSPWLEVTLTVTGQRPSSSRFPKIWERNKEMKTDTIVPISWSLNGCD